MFKINRFSITMLAIAAIMILASCGPWPTVRREPTIDKLIVSPEIRCVEDPVTITWGFTPGENTSGAPIGLSFNAETEDPYHPIYRNQDLSGSIVVHLESEVFEVAGVVPTSIKTLFYLNDSITSDTQYNARRKTIRTIYQNEEFPNRPATLQENGNWSVIFPSEVWSGRLVAVKFGVTLPANLQNNSVIFQYDKGPDVTGLLDAGNNWVDDVAILPSVTGTWTVSPANDYTRQNVDKDDVEATITVFCPQY